VLSLLELNIIPLVILWNLMEFLVWNPSVLAYWQAGMAYFHQKVEYSTPE